jgi:hypothetical protein
MISKGRIIMEHYSAAHETSPTSQSDLAEGFRQMTADREREAEAEEWAEALIADVVPDEG